MNIYGPCFWLSVPWKGFSQCLMETSALRRNITVTEPSSAWMAPGGAAAGSPLKTALSSARQQDPLYPQELAVWWPPRLFWWKRLNKDVVSSVELLGVFSNYISRLSYLWVMFYKAAMNTELEDSGSLLLEKHTGWSFLESGHIFANWSI